MHRVCFVVAACLAGATSGYIVRSLLTNERVESPARPVRQISDTNKTKVTAQVIKQELDAQGRLRDRLNSSKSEQLKAQDLLPDLKIWLKADPQAAMAFVFHEVSPELSLELLPLLGEQLASLEDSSVTAALATVRTEKEMKLAWDAVMQARLATSPEAAVKLARLAPPLSGAVRRLVALAAASGGDAGVLALVDAGADKAWLFPSILDVRGGPEWLATANVKSSVGLLTALRQRYGPAWTDADTLRYASVVSGTAPDTAEVLKLVAGGTFRTARASDITKFVRNLAVNSTEGLKVVFDNLPEGFQKRRLAQYALALPERDKHLRDEIAKVIPAVESATGARRPLASDIEMKLIAEPESGAAYAVAAAAPEEDRAAMISHAAKFALMVGGPPGLVKSLSGLPAEEAEPRIYEEAARLLMEARPDGLKENEQDALRSLKPHQAAALRAALNAHQSGAALVGQLK